MKKSFNGIGASPGIAVGKAWIYRPTEVEIKRVEKCIPDEEITRLQTALVKAKTQLGDLHKLTMETIGAEEAAIFEAHQMFLDDPVFIDSINSRITSEKINAEAAVDQVVDQYAREMMALPDEYFQARAQDIRDVGRRMINCLAGIDVDKLKNPEEPMVILAEDLAPSDTVQFDRAKILGLCTIRGGPTSHTAILARSLGVPAAVSVPFSLDEIIAGEILILNGSTGELILNPEENELELARKDRESWLGVWKDQLEMAFLPAKTIDDHIVEVVANIGNVEDAHQAINYGAEGVGLLRTEFLYLDRSQMPDETEQIEKYREIFNILGDKPIVVRTLDIGGDKAVPYLGLKEEPNPFLGWRAIRMISERPDVLNLQFRALLQAGVNSDLRMMIPMVASVEEVMNARYILDEAVKQLIEEGKPVPLGFQFGIMVEVPSAALIVERIAPYVDFFSIGTNDLTQYTLAVDRTNERVAGLASPFHPAVIQLIQKTIEAAHQSHKWVGLCGEMAGDVLATPLLLGLGLDEFSMAPTSVPAVKEKIRMLSYQDCKKTAIKASSLTTTEEVREFLKK